MPVRPLYSASLGGTVGAAATQGAFYTVRRLPRRRTAEERRYGASSDYTGTDMFISFGDAGEFGRSGCNPRRTKSARALLQPASDRASAGRRGRRRFSPFGRRHPRRDLRRRSDAAARTGGGPASQPQRDRPSAAPSLGG